MTLPDPLPLGDLVLTVPDPDADLADLHAVVDDERVWRHYPQLRPTDPAETAADLRAWRAAWERDGLGLWIARRGGVLVGYGGCALRHDAFWNVSYRIAADAHGHGYATLIAAAGVRQAGERRPDRPVVAYLLANNPASARVAEKLGLTLRLQGPDVGNPNPGAVRLVYADRPLDADQRAAVLR